VEEIQGLTESEARERRERGLGNDIEVRTGRTYRDIARANLFTTYNNILFVIGVALVALGRYYDAATSVGIGLANALIGTAQEVRAFTVASGSSARHLQLAIRASGDETRVGYTTCCSRA
jgi:magnesium-transporting ATPase (P-type)